MILSHLHQNPGGCTAKEIMEELDLEPEQVYAELVALEANDLVKIITRNIGNQPCFIWGAA